MAGVRFTELQSRPMAFLDCTSVTLEEFLTPPDFGVGEKALKTVG
jgi:hypothetical protein